ncbi:MAG: DUF1127 domain-containing protein [Roseobacter sp.]
MAHTAHRIHPISAPGLVKNALVWIWDGLIYLGENSSRARIVHEINAMSDAELEERGLTRAEVVRRVMSDGYHL